MKFDGRTFEIQIVSDIVRDGMCLEAWETSEGRSVQVAEVFYSDISERLAFTAYEKSLPLGLVENMCRTAQERLVPETELTGGN
ncbi:hypothetical protein [Rhizobium sp.]